MSTDAAYFGIDFGTTNSSMAWYNPELGRAEIILNSEGEQKTPSLVFFGEEDEEILVGKPVEDQLELAGDTDDPQEREEIGQRLLKSIKRDLLYPPLIPIPGREPVRPVEVVAWILGKLKADAEAGHFYEEMERVVITCPAIFGAREREVILEAALMAGFGRVELLEEPTAAAIAFSRLGRKVGKGVLVYDLGAGTFDLSVVARDEDDGSFYVPMEAEGDDGFGGDDLDLALYRYCDGIARGNLGQPISLTGKPDLAFLRQCRARKENFSTSVKVRFGSYLATEEGPPARFRQEIDRETFEGLIRDRIEGTVRKTARLLERAKDRGHEVETVVLIGGSSQVPLVKRLLAEALPVEPRAFSEKDYAVALGAAYHAFDLWKPQEKRQEREEEGHGTSEQRHPQQTSTEIVVSPGPGQPIQTIGQALREVRPGGRIRVRPGVYQESLVIDKPVEIIGEQRASENVVVEGAEGPCLSVSAEGGTLKGLVLRRLEDPEEQRVEYRPAVMISSRQVTVEECDITSATGACVLIHGPQTNPTVRCCKIHDMSYGVDVASSEGVMEDCEIFGNVSFGATLHMGANLHLLRCTITRNGGQAIFATSGTTVTVENCNLEGNARGPWNIGKGAKVHKV